MSKQFVFLVAGLSLAITIGGCYTYGSPFNSGNVKRLVLDRTTMSQTDSLFGEPYAEEFRNAKGLRTFIDFYYYADESAVDGSLNQHRLSIEFRHDTLNGYIFESSYPGESTAFERQAAGRVKTGESTRDDVRQILGEPTGIVNCPTNLIAAVFGKIQAEKIDDSTAQVWTYFYFYHKTDEVDTTEMFLVYLDPSGRVRDKYFNVLTRKD